MENACGACIDRQIPHTEQKKGSDVSRFPFLFQPDDPTTGAGHIEPGTGWGTAGQLFFKAAMRSSMGG